MLSKWTVSLLYFLLMSSSFSVISFRNTVQSIIGLVVCFLTASVLLLYLRCEFFAFLFLIIYVGAIAVLFLFVIMMIELKNIDNTSSFTHITLSVCVPVFFVVWLFPFLLTYFSQNPYLRIYQINDYALLHNYFSDFYVEDGFTEIEAIGQLLYTRYALHFLIIGLILTLAVLSVGVLTINSKRSFTEINELLISRRF